MNYKDKLNYLNQNFQRFIPKLMINLLEYNFNYYFKVQLKYMISESSMETNFNFIIENFTTINYFG